MRIYIGVDSREMDAYAVAEKTARAFGCETYPVREEVLRYYGLLTRPTDRRGGIWAHDEQLTARSAEVKGSGNVGESSCVGKAGG